MKLNLTNLRARLERRSVQNGRPIDLVFKGEVSATFTPCRLWTGATNGLKNPAGILTVRVPGEPHPRKLYVHRLAFWLARHPNRKGLCTVPDPLPLVRQTCGNLLCIEPSHLERKP